MGGYDKRRYTNGKRQISYRTSEPFPNIRSHYVADTVCSVVSYRTNPTGEPVLDSTADPYAYFLGQSSRRKRDAAIAARKLGSTESPVVDNGHAFWLERHSIKPGNGSGSWYANLFPIYSVGGPITTCGAYIDTVPDRMLFKYRSSETNVQQRSYVTPWAHLSTWDVNFYGSRAISTLAPTRPEMNLSAALAEFIREGLPKAVLLGTFRSIVSYKRLTDKNSTTWDAIIKGFSKGAKGASEDYLNFMFGILPLARDIVSLVTTLQRSEQILADYQSNAGKGVRRDMILKDTAEQQVFRPSDLYDQGQVGVAYGHWPATLTVGTSDNQAIANPSSIQTTVFQELKEKISFSGSFSYYIPLPEGFWGKMKSYNAQWERLIGRPLSYETLWELTPWSWLADWFFDIQGALRLVDLVQDDNLVINYGYLMRSVTATTTVVSELGWSSDKKRAIKSASTQYVSHRVERVRANPFGFSLKAPGDLSVMQMSLLGAVGIANGIK